MRQSSKQFTVCSLQFTVTVTASNFEKGGEISRNLFSIYVFMNRELLNANIQKDTKPLESVKQMLMELRGAWNQINEKGRYENTTTRTGGINIAG